MRVMAAGPDFITIDGGEGGTGAAPLIFADHVSLPFQDRLHAGLQHLPRGENGLDRSPGSARQARASPTARSWPCRSAPTWSTSPARRCSRSAASRRRSATPTAAPRASRPRARICRTGLDPIVQSKRFARFCQSLRNEILAVTHACGYEHPSQFTAEDIEFGAGPAMFKTLRELYGYSPDRSSWDGIEGWSTALPSRKAA